VVIGLHPDELFTLGQRDTALGQVIIDETSYLNQLDNPKADAIKAWEQYQNLRMMELAIRKESPSRTGQDDSESEACRRDSPMGKRNELRQFLNPTAK
jgi:hypothetical protein